MDGNLKNLGSCLDNFDEGDKRKIEQVVLLYLHNFRKALIESEKTILKDFYSLIDAIRMTTSKIDR